MDLIAIQYLRGIAAMMVVVYHLEPQLERMGYQGSWPACLSAGVDIFFVISGFIMWVTTAGKSVSPFAFYKKRIARIVPLYWVVTTFVVALMLISPKLLQTSMFDFEHVVTSFLFLASEHPVKHRFEPVVFPGWTLNYEMFFYLIFGFALRIDESRRLDFILALFGGLVVFGALFIDPHPRAGLYSRAGFYTNSILLEFVFGVIVGFVYLQGWKPSWPTALALALGGFAAIGASAYWGGGVPRFLLFGLPALFIVAGVVAFEHAVGVLKLFLPRLLGDASYSIYLSHYIALSALGQFWRKLHFSVEIGGFVLFSVVAVLVATGAGVGLYYLVERPLGNLAKRMMQPC